MRLLENYLERKNGMLGNIEAIHKMCEEQVAAIGNEFIRDFKEMIANASEEEFHEFMCESGNKLDTTERMAALTARLENYGKRCKDKEEKETNEPDDKSNKKNDGPHIMVIGLG